MYQTELPYFIILTVIILFSQYLPTNLLLLLDNFIVRALIVILLLYLVSLGPTAGIVGLMMVSTLYLERNKRKIAVAAAKLDKMDLVNSKYATVKEASAPQTTVPVNEFDKPEHEESDFFPDNTCDSDNFEAVAPSINEKAVLSTIYPLNRHAPESGSASDNLYEKLGFGHIQGVETMGDNS
jgi:hypothetical protein